MPASLDSLLRLDAQLESAGHHPLTPWWRAQLTRFYQHPTARAFVGRVGRGGAKSHTSTKIGLNETLAGDWKIPPGERHYWAYVSLNKEEAAQRLLLLERFLTDLRIPYTRNGDEIALNDMPRGFRVFACQIGSVSGFRCYGYSADELAKWRSRDNLSNPAVEVVASLNAMTVTHKQARRVLISSPFGMVDYHFDRCELGNTSSQVFAEAPSWIANPGITKEETEQLEPDERVWRREYAAIPQTAVSSAFDYDSVIRAFRTYTFGTLFSQGSVITIDASSGKGDAFVWAVATWAFQRLGNPLDGCPLDSEGNRYCYLDATGRVVSDLYELTAPYVVKRDDNGYPVWKAGQKRRTASRFLLIEDMDSVDGKFYGHVSLDEICDRIAVTASHWKTRTVIGDAYEQGGIESHLRARGLKFYPHPWTAPAKAAAIKQLRRLFADDEVLFPDQGEQAEKLKAELLAYQERITASGSLAYDGKRGMHDDRVAAVLNVLIHDLAVDGRHLPGSPLRPGPLDGGAGAAERARQQALIFT